MGRAGDSLDDEFPPRSGGGSPLEEELLVGRKRCGPGMKWLLLNLISSLKIIIVEPGGPRPVSLALVFLVYGEIMSFKCKENHRPPGLAFCCCGRFRCSLRFFLFLFFSLFFIFSFSCKDSHEKCTWQASRLSTSGASFSGSRARILYKSAHAKVLFT